MHKKMTVLGLCLTTGLLLSGCISTQKMQFDRAFDPTAGDSRNVEVLDSANVKRSYKVIGIVEADAVADYGLNNVLSALKLEAKKMGGQAVIDVQRVPMYSKTFWDGLFPSGQRWSGKVITWE